MIFACGGLKFYTLIPKTFSATNFQTKNCPKVCNAETFLEFGIKVVFCTENPVLLKIVDFSDICDSCKTYDFFKQADDK